MLYTCFHVTKRKIAAVCFVLAACITMAVLLCGNAGTDMTKPVCREEYLSSIKVNVSKKSFSKNKIVIPDSFSNVYLKYNELQKESGFDLKKYSGKTVTQYTYKVNDKENTVINLLVFNKKLIGGDICETNLGGRMYPLPVG